MTTPGHDANRFWELPELVERFAARDPDVRMMRILGDYDDPQSIRVLDLGCAGGRNTEPLAELGFDVFAVDSSHAMIERTRERLRPILGRAEAVARVTADSMEDLGRFEDSSFALVLGLGIYHQAASPEAWARAVSETARLLAPGGLLLYASFHPETAPDGAPGVPVPGRPGMYSGFRSGTVYLIGPEELDRRLGELGLHPRDETVVARVETETGTRVTVNGLYEKRGGP